MASKIKQKIAKNLYKGIYNKLYNGRYDEFFSCMKLIQKKENKISWKVALPFHSKQKTDVEFFKTTQKELLESQTIKNLTCTTSYNELFVHLELNVKDFIKDILESNPTALNYEPLSQKVIVEFSSPNIAKPFHVGHLRSTIIGNTLSNIKKKLGKNVVKINYLGDWGTQFGMIKVGMRLENYSDEDLQKNPIKMLFNAYVRGNREAQRNSEIYDEAKKVFADLEEGNEEILSSWQKYKKWTVDDLSKVYEALGVSFDHYNWESDYKRKEADVILKMLEEKGILSVDEKKRIVAVLDENQIPLVKSDNTTLYLLRDIMAVLDRKSKHDFDEMLYIVENGQNLHFTTLFKLCEELKINENKKLQHVKFGRIHGMSTRKGDVTFLSDILEEATKRSYEEQLKSKFTKVSLDNTDVSAILGASAVIVNDLKQRRLKDYEFSWDKTVQVKGDTGIHLQYCHCRLFNLEEYNSALPIAVECDPDALLEPEAINLVVNIARFEEALKHADDSLEPCHLISFLFQLVKAINVAFKVLKVQGSETHVGSQRLLLFNKSKKVLHEGLTLIGLKTLTKM